MIYHSHTYIVNKKGASFLTSLIQLYFLIQLFIQKKLINLSVIFIMSLNKSELIKIDLILKKLQKKKIISIVVRLAFWDLINEVQHFGKFHITKTKLSELLEVQFRQIERYLLHLEEIGLVFRDYTTHNINDREVGNSLYLTLIHPKEILSYYLFYGKCNIRKHLIDKRTHHQITDIVCISNTELFCKNYYLNRALDNAVKPVSDIKFLAKIKNEKIELETIKYLSYTA